MLFIKWLTFIISEIDFFILSLISKSVSRAFLKRQPHQGNAIAACDSHFSFCIYNFSC